MHINQINHSSTLPLFFLLNGTLMALFCFINLPELAMTSPLTLLFSLTMVITYGVVYLIPALLITAFCQGLFHILCLRPRPRAVQCVAVLTTFLTMALLFADHVVFRLFNFHINGFVWNLMTTPGGINSMGGSHSTTITYSLIMMAILALQTGMWALCHRLHHHIIITRKIQFWGIGLLVIIATSQACIYGVSSFKNNLPIINLATALPLYQPLTIKGFAKRIHLKAPTTKQMAMQPRDGTLHYPLEPLTITPTRPPANIVWLVAESWRADSLTPEIMPQMTDFAGQAIRFNQHYSGGNGTRMGLFSQFYGLYGAYWFQFLNEQRSPMIMDVLQQQNYQLSMYSSGQFSYPEFNKTLFSNIPKKFLHDSATGAGWQRDRANVDHMLEFLNNRDTSRPFMTFMFFESPHARYYFPKEDAIRTPYLQDFNYATMSLKDDIELIRNRYLNSVHHLDSQLARITDYLQQENLLENTIVIITGDHGEEFMENGHWGHNSEFTEQQVRVPLLLHIPGHAATEVTYMTSHLDLPATIMPLLGVNNDPAVYSLGFDLLGEKQRDYTIISDWSRIAYIDSKLKAVIPFSDNRGISRSYFTTKQDNPLSQQQEFWQKRQTTMVKVLHNLSLFFQVGS